VAAFRWSVLEQSQLLCSVPEFENHLLFYGRHGGRPLHSNQLCSSDATHFVLRVAVFAQRPLLREAACAWRRLACGTGLLGRGASVRSLALDIAARPLTLRVKGWLQGQAVAARNRLPFVAPSLRRFVASLAPSHHHPQFPTPYVVPL